MHVVWAILRQNRLGGLTSRGEPEKSQKVLDSHRNDVSPLTQGLRYRAACDGDPLITAILLAFTVLFKKMINIMAIARWLHEAENHLSMAFPVSRLTALPVG